MLLLKNVLHKNVLSDILIDQGRFVRIRETIEADSDTDVIDCADKAIMPSFCNMHTHAAMMFLRGVGEDKELFQWLQEDIWPREARLTPEHTYHLSRFALLEMIKTGTTLFCDMYGFPEETIRAVDEMGLRAAVSTVGIDFFDAAQTQAKKESFLRFFEQPAPSSRIIKGMACHAIYSTSEALFKEAKALADRHQTFLHIHAAETEKEVADCIQAHHCRPIELLSRWGVLGEKTVLAHCLHLTDAEIRLLVDTKTSVAHCPSSSLKLNSGQMDLQRLLDAGVRMTLGTDGVSSNNSLSMMTEMKLAALSAKNKAASIFAAKVDDVYQMATRNGFSFFGINAGKIEEGCVADFILLDLNNPLLQPTPYLQSHLIYAADSSCITDVFCNGQAVMRDRVIPREAEIMAAFKSCCRDLLSV